MAIDKDLLWEKLDAHWQNPSVASLPIQEQRYVIFSDLHMGNGKGADDFAPNKRALVLALGHYFKAGFKVILLGDIEELWQFDLDDIIAEYDQAIYARLRKFSKSRLLRIFGNHDREWGGFIDPAKSKAIPQVFAPEAVKLQDQGKDRFLLVHGHQGSIESDKFSWFSRFWVRAYAGVEPILKLTGLIHNPSSTKSQIAKDYESNFYSWAKFNKVIVMCGHSHRAIFASRSHGERIQEKINELQVKTQTRGVKREQKSRYMGQIDQLQRELEDEREKGRLIEPVEPNDEPLPCYFNTGCGLYTDGITAIEIEQGEIRLVKWNKYERNVEPRQVFNSARLKDLYARIG